MLSKFAIIAFLFLSILPSHVHAATPASKFVFIGTGGKLQYYTYADGTKLPDFSYAGYMGGGVKLPDVPVVKTVSPVAGDDTVTIQAALNEIGNLPINALGVRGTVLLKKGTYEIGSQLIMNKSGVVLRGSGQGASATILKGTGSSQRFLIQAGGTFNRTEIPGTRQPITNSYVAVGSQSFTIANASAYAVGDKIIVFRPSTQAWIDALGMDACSSKGTSYDTNDTNGSTCLDGYWKPGERDIANERIITALSGNTITIDAPIVQAIDSKFGGGSIYQYSFPGRINNVGIENLRADSTYTSSTDEAHALGAVEFQSIENAWIRDVTAIHFYNGVVKTHKGSKWITVQDSSSLDPVSQITGARRYPFHIDDGELILMQRNYAKSGRHSFVTGSDVSGPNVFLDSRAENSYADSGPHHRYATGELYDNISDLGTASSGINARNRGNMGSGHGWAGAQQVMWNCQTVEHIIQSPPHALNWSIGCTASKYSGNGQWDAKGTKVTPRSLYLKQLEDRLGAQAVSNIAKSAYGLPTPEPTIPAIGDVPNPQCLGASCPTLAPVNMPSITQTPITTDIPTATNPPFVTEARQPTIQPLPTNQSNPPQTSESNSGLMLMIINLLLLLLPLLLKMSGLQ